MNQVVIVDDEMMVRVMLRSLLKWEALGFTVAADFSRGKTALEYLRHHRADLLILDMKIPDLDGISLMKSLQEAGMLPVTVVLSGYDDFPLVREAFRLGAYDYLLKSDLNRESLEPLLRKLKQNIFLDSGQSSLDKSMVLESMVSMLPKKGQSLWTGQQNGPCGMVLFAVNEGRKQAIRFGENLEEYLQKPMVELARQLPRIAAHGKVTAIDPFHYALIYQASNHSEYRHTICSIVRQLLSVWQDYMNLTVSAAVSDLVWEEGQEEDMEEAYQNKLELCRFLLKLSVLSGKHAICTEWEWNQELLKIRQDEKADDELLSALYRSDIMAFEMKKRQFFGGLEGLPLLESCSRCLVLIARLAAVFEAYGDDFYSLFPEDADYRNKLKRIMSMGELELWMNNYFRWVTDYLKKHHDQPQDHMILRAKHFLTDNYSNPELTLKSVADYIGLNEKYFSSRFTKEVGITFSAYLTDIRMQKAKHLIVSTGLRMYEISERVGYQNVEHFNRMFKRSFGISPGDYRKKNIQRN